MKFSELGPGGRFEWDGAVYVKLGPVSAREEATGRLRMIPRYARLRPVEAAAGEAPDAQPGTPSTAELRAAFDAFFGACLAALEEPPAVAKARLYAARQRFLTTLGLD